jgi:hypothetical protein
MRLCANLEVLYFAMNSERYVWCWCVSRTLQMLFRHAICALLRHARLSEMRLFSAAERRNQEAVGASRLTPTATCCRRCAASSTPLRG